MQDKIYDSIHDAIHDAVITIPGVVSFVEIPNSDLENEIKQTEDSRKAIYIDYTNGIYHIRIHVMLLLGVNIPDVLYETQIRVKYELEKRIGLSDTYIIDVAVDKLGSY